MDHYSYQLHVRRIQIERTIELQELRGSVLDILRGNDPDVSEISIYLRRQDFSDAEIAQALNRNEYVTNIEINTHAGMGDDASSWPLLRRELATRERLKEVRLNDYGPDGRATSAQITPFLQAFQENQSIQSVTLDSLVLSEGTVASFLDTTRTVTSFCISGHCVIESVAEGDHNYVGTQTIAAALQRNRQVQNLRLEKLNDSLLLPIIRSLVGNDTLRVLNLWWLDSTNTVEVSLAIQQLLESTSSIQRFSMQGNCSEEKLGSIGLGLANSRTVVEVEFDPYFNYSRSVLINLIRSKRNLRSLTFPQLGSRELHGALNEALLSPESSLHSLSVDTNCWGSGFPITALRALLEAVKKSKLEELLIRNVSGSTEHVRALVETLPGMKIKKLSLHQDQENFTNGEILAILQALKRNFNLLTVKVEGLNGPEEERLQFYLDRNKRLAQWIDNPLTVPQQLWPDAMKLAMEAGATSLFQSLLTLSGHAIGSLQGKRKRKRPHYYEPPSTS